MNNEKQLEKMLNSSITNKALKKYADAGIEVVKFDNDNKKMYITVPKSSDDGLAGDELATEVKASLKSSPFGTYRVLYKIRDEHWTKAQAEENLRKLKEQINQFIKEQDAKRVLDSY